MEGGMEESEYYSGDEVGGWVSSVICDGVVICVGCFIEVSRYVDGKSVVSIITCVVDVYYSILLPHYNVWFSLMYW